LNNVMRVTHWKAAMLLAAISAVMFVVVCPIAPTPTAVFSGQASLLTLALALAATVVLPVTLTIQQRVLAAPPPLMITQPSADLLDLNCTRLC
jgi:hypothetical protein